MYQKDKEIVLESKRQFLVEVKKTKFKIKKKKVRSSKDKDDGSQSQSEEVSEEVSEEESEEVSDNNSDNEPLSPSPEDIDDHAESQNSFTSPTDRKLRSQRRALDVKLDADKVNVNTLAAITILSF
jgi:hypothetical protein